MEERHDKSLIAIRGCGRIIARHCVPRQRRLHPGAATLNPDLSLSNGAPPNPGCRPGCDRGCGDRILTWAGTCWKDHRRSSGASSDRQLPSSAGCPAEARRERHRHGCSGVGPAKAPRAVEVSQGSMAWTRSRLAEGPYGKLQRRDGARLRRMDPRPRSDHEGNKNGQVHPHDDQGSG